ncbi:MAG: beta strand repeat-containing protein [Gemmataceae bacterium]
MKRKFSKLRIERLEDKITPTATAAPFNLPAGGATWNIANNGGAFPISPGQSGFAIVDAQLVGPPARSDAYDNAFMMAVNGTVYQDPDGTVDLTGTTVTTDAVALSGLNSWIEYYFDPSSATVRAVYNFSNPSAADISVDVQIGTNLGSDAGTGSAISATSSGDTTLDSADRWFVSSDNLAHDPDLTFVRYGTGSVVTPATLKSPLALQDNYEEQFSITVPAGQTRRIMVFGQLHQDSTTATTDAATFDSNATLTGSGLLSGLNTQQLSEIVNWDFVGPSVTIDQSGVQADPSNASSISFDVVFSEPVTGFDLNDVVIGGTAGATNISTSGSGTTYTVLISGMTQSGTVTASIKAGAVQDAVGNDSLASTSIDNSVYWSAGPQGSLQASDITDVGAGNNIDAVTVAKYTFTVTYTDVDLVDPVFFDDTDIVITGPNGFNTFAHFVSSNPSFDSSPITATYEFVPPGGKWDTADNGDYTVTLQANEVFNDISFGNNAAILGSFNVDMHVPSVTVDQAALQADPTNGASITFDVVFSEPVTGFDLNGVVVGGTAGPSVIQVSGSGTTYTITVSGMAQSGTVTADVNANAATDISDEGNTVSTSSDNSVYWSSGPQASLQASDVIDVGGGNNIDAVTVSKYTFTLTYTDPDLVDPVFLDDTDVLVTGPNGFSTFAHFVSANPAIDSASIVATYEFTPPGGKWDFADNGDYTITLQTDEVRNDLGFGNAAAVFSINVDMHLPTVTINQAAGQADPAIGTSAQFTVIFSEPVTGFTAADIVIGGTAGATTAVVSGSGTTYTVTISGATQSGTVTASINAGAAFDISDDGNTASTSTDNTVTLIIVTPPTPHVALFATGADAGGGPQVNVYNADGSLRFSFFAYSANFFGGVRVATGDLNGDGIDDIVTAPGPTGGPHIKVFSGANGALLGEFFAYDASFFGGVYVALGDVNNDGTLDIITGADAGGGPHVKVFDAVSRSEIRSFFAYSAAFSGGVRVASGDVDNDGFDDIITGAGPGGGPHVIAYSGKTGAILQSFFAYGSDFHGGVDVAAGDVNNDGFADIITGAGAGATPHVKVFSGANQTLLRSFLAYAGGFAGGVRVAADDLDGDGFADIITGAGPGGGPHVLAYSGQNQSTLRSFFAYDPSFSGGVYVG